MTATSRTATVHADLLDAEDVPTGRQVQVRLEVIRFVDNYGEDADGRRGERRIEFDITETHIDSAEQLSERQRYQVTREAVAMFMRNPVEYLNDCGEEY